ncbi:UPF0545 protein C22orf39 homolog isoform X2 [Varroa jacobsoni]|uniref:UPF0545 protein C22orf39 homolog isoform X2 n=1 Tax=Varroa jacobsoni TaxID=62625 RepID=UPI000BF59F88|nr:UPF0545 protein C22orf39 homolog isoform X2 [Varroa jacobsoni]
MAKKEQNNKTTTEDINNNPTDSPPWANSPYAKYNWMMRPCEVYEDEYNDCISMRARLHQKFIFGEYVDCSDWKSDRDNCFKWRTKKDLVAFDNVVRSELQRKVKRNLATLATSSVWEFRETPPSQEEWCPELPSFLKEKMEKSTLGELHFEEKRSCIIL